LSAARPYAARHGPSRSCHRAPAPRQTATPNAAVDAASSRDGDLDSYLAALAPRPPRVGELTGRFGSAQVLQLRLPAPRIEQLRRLAHERGTSPGAPAVDWVIERLDHEDTPTGPVPMVADDGPRRRGRRRLGRR
jgi:hypothetical protein